MVNFNNYLCVSNRTSRQNVRKEIEDSEHRVKKSDPSEAYVKHRNRPLLNTDSFQVYSELLPNLAIG